MLDELDRQRAEQLAIGEGMPTFETHGVRRGRVLENLQRSEDVSISGIGLSIVKKSLELLGGEVGIDSATGRGTTNSLGLADGAAERAA